MVEEGTARGTPWAARTAAVILGVVLVATGETARAHDTWLLPVSWRLAAGQQAQFDMTSAMTFPAPETAVAADRLAATGARLAGRVAPLRPGATAGGALRVSADTAGEGVLVAWAVSRPRTIDARKPEDVEHYLEEIGALDTIAGEWKAAGRPAWKETYSKVAKTFVRVGKDVPDESWREPVGVALELVPEADPTLSRVGGRLGVRLLWQGRPVAGQSVTAVFDGGSQRLRTDRDGQAVFPITRPGPWLLKTTRLVRGMDGSWESTFSTLTFSAMGGTP